MRPVPQYHVLTKDGDATGEVEEVLLELGNELGNGLHRYFFVSRAKQTVVMTVDASSPVAQRLRARQGWLEPGMRAFDS